MANAHQPPQHRNRSPSQYWWAVLEVADLLFQNPQLELKTAVR